MDQELRWEIRSTMLMRSNVKKMLANLSQESNQARERPGGVHIPEGEENVFVYIRTVVWAFLRIRIFITQDAKKYSRSEDIGTYWSGGIVPMMGKQQSFRCNTSTEQVCHSEAHVRGKRAERNMRAWKITYSTFGHNGRMPMSICEPPHA